MTILSSAPAAHTLTSAPHVPAATTTTAPGRDEQNGDRGATAVTTDGAYRADALRLVRAAANAEELAALVAALLLTRRAHEQQHGKARDGEWHRPAWTPDRHPVPGSRAAAS